MNALDLKILICFILMAALIVFALLSNDVLNSKVYATLAIITGSLANYNHKENQNGTNN